MGAVIVAVVGVVVLGFVLASIFVRRHGESDAPVAGWQATDEVFNDPSTDRLMRVWVDPTGERHYVPEGHHPTA